MIQGVGSASPSRLNPPLVPSDIAKVQVGFLYPPVGGDLLRLVALHVFLHGGQAGAVFQADGALVRGSAVVGPEVLDHGGVVSGPLVAQLALKGLLACRERHMGTGVTRSREGGSGTSPGTARNQTSTGEALKHFA